MPHDLPAPVPPVIRADGWAWRHPGRKSWAVQNATFTISPGERILLVGSSGAGKSTLLHGLAGVLDDGEGESRGSLTIGDQPAASPRVRGRVGLVQQDPESQRVMGRVGDEVAFGLENLGVPQAEMWPRVRDALRVVGLEYPLDHPTSELSGGEKQRLAQACALAMRPQIMLLDEPTANLDEDGAAEVRRASGALADATGATLVVIDHNLAPWLEHADRLVVMTEGGIVADGPPSDVIAGHRDTLLRAGVWLPDVDPLDHVPSTLPEPAPTGDRALETDDLAVGYEPGKPLRSGMTLTFPDARSTCIVGPNGAGKTTLALTLAGLLSPVEGHVRVGRTVQADTATADPSTWKPAELLGRISMVFQEPQYQFVTSSVEEELALGPRLAGMNAEDVDVLVDLYLERLRLTPLRKAHPLSLSGGERRRLGVGTALIASPSIVILDEPTFGQDFNTWCQVVALLKEARSRGVTLITVTHDPDLVRALGEEVVVLEGGAASLSAVRAESPSVSGALASGAGSPAGMPASDAAPGRQVRPWDWGRARRGPRPGEAPRKPALSRVNPAVQLLGLFLMTIPLMATIDPVSAGVAVALETLLLPLAGLRPRQLLLRLLPLLVAAPLAALSMLLYAAPGGEIYAAWGPVVISQNSVTLAISIALRVLAVGMPAVVILPGLGSTEVADALTQVAHLPSRFVLSSLAAIRMVGLMLSDWQALRRARRSRGLKGSNFARSAFALVTFALRRADSLSVSMEARGFGSDIPRTNARNSTLSRADAVMLIAAVFVPTVALMAASLTGSFALFGIAR